MKKILLLLLTTLTLNSTVSLAVQKKSPQNPAKQKVARHKPVASLGPPKTNTITPTSRPPLKPTPPPPPLPPPNP